MKILEMEGDDEKKIIKKNVVYIIKILKLYKNLFIISCSFNYNFLIFKSFNFFYFNIFFIFDSIHNLIFIKIFLFLSKKILLGKKFYQKSLLKKSINNFIKIVLKKYIFLIKLKSGDINFFSRINNEIFFYFINNINYNLLPGLTSFLLLFSKFKLNLSFRFKISNLLFFTYFSCLNIFKFKYFLNKFLIYYMIGSNFNYFNNYFENFNFNYLYIIESFNFLYENFLVFNVFDFFLINKNFLFYFLPKLIIFYDNFLNFDFNFFFLNFF